jgi:hypothetical protein
MPPSEIIRRDYSSENIQNYPGSWPDQMTFDFSIAKITQYLSQQTKQQSDSANNKLNEPINYRPKNRLTDQTTVLQTESN